MKRGPKPQPEAHRATKVLRARVTPEECEIARRIAEREQTTVSDLIRDALSNYRTRRVASVD